MAKLHTTTYEREKKITEKIGQFKPSLYDTILPSVLFLKTGGIYLLRQSVQATSARFFTIERLITFREAAEPRGFAHITACYTGWQITKTPYIL